METDTTVYDFDDNAPDDERERNIVQVDLPLLDLPGTAPDTGQRDTRPSL